MQNRQDPPEAFPEKAGDGTTHNSGSLLLASTFMVVAGTIVPGYG